LQGVEKEFEGFKRIFNKFLQSSKTSVEWAKIDKLPEGAVRDYKTLGIPASTSEIKDMLAKLVVVKLNGGLGTSMGCRGPKSVIPVSGFIVNESSLIE
jgi:UTP--glucose-1-phosphate uridylyltransferase